MKLLPSTSTLRASRSATIRSGRLTFQSGLVVILVLGVVAPVIAQDPPLPREKRDCNNLPQGDNMSKADRINARLDCRAENVNIEVATLVDQASKSEGIFTAEQKSSMQNMHARSENARKRSKEEGSFKGLGRKQKSTCYVQEAVNGGNGDGVCTNRGGTRETCAEVIGDGIGNDDGICETTGNPKEVCVEICESPLNDQDDDNFDDEDSGAAAEMEGLLLDTEKMMVEANQKMAAGLKAFTQARQALTTTAEDGDECKDILQETRVWIYIDRALFTILAESGSVAYDMCSAYGGQTIAGFNSKSVCMVFAGVKGVLNIVLAGWAIAEEIITEKAFDESLRCMEQSATVQSDTQATALDTQAQLDVTDGRVGVIDGKVDALQVTVGGTSDKVEEIERKVDALNARLGEVLDLLNTPAGRRPEFPKRP